MKRLCLLIALAGLVTISAPAQDLSDTSSLEAFLDGVIEAYRAEKHIAGATLTVVRDGGVLVKKGYGFSDVTNQVPVDPDSTLFRIGSISKMFTWISVMQLVSQGKLDLNADVNTYLTDFKIPEAFGQPITLKHLMTHTPGFEDHVLKLFVRDSTGLRPLGEILRDELPMRVRAPNTQASYSNHGTGIAAYIVEQVSGLSFNDYVEKNILQPLGMNVTSFRQPLPGNLKAMMSKGYRFGEALQSEGFEYVPLYPVGAAASSAGDMTKFMMALLNGGRLGDANILDSATLSMMKSPAHRHHPDVNPMRYGFMDVSQNGETVIGHGGDTFWFHSLMALLPDHKVGFFLSFNTDQGGGVYLDVFEEFMDRYFPEKEELRDRLTVTREWLERFAGEYNANRHPVDDLTRIASLMGRVKVSVVDSTRLKMVANDEATIWLPIDSLTFREEFKSDRLAFGKDEDGNIRFMYLGLLPIFALEKTQGWESSSVQTSLFAWEGIIMLLALLYWPVASRIRKNYQPMIRAKARLPMVTKVVAWLNYFFLLLFVVLFAVGMGEGIEIVYGVGSAIKVALVCPLLMIATTLLMLVFLVQLLRDGRYRTWSRIYYLILSGTSILTLVQLYYWNFVGFRY